MSENRYNINIKGNRVKISSVEVEDAVIYYREFDEEITRYQFAKPFKTVREAEKLIKNFIELRISNINDMFNIYDEAGNFIGSLEVYGLYKEYPEVGIWICGKYRNKGYAKESLCILRKYFEQNYNIKGLIYEADIRNEASLQLIKQLNGEKVGYNEVKDNGKTLKLERYLF